ncbi:hypothetical protein [Polyangium sp. 6x1]|uniref:hypothetical protein n=1 Tax=Polyangium sp. 6x1 TaxID=3042689 RepID=UPI0024826927|nr:hypothetical protein [Polyangium sp. 6x1]MDI1444648.1 hypothetical protein [Polyangium sp. 6x1]
MTHKDLGLALEKRNDLIELLRDADRGGRALWAIADHDLEIEAAAILTRRNEARVYFGAAPELRALALLPPLCEHGADERAILRAAREAVFAALAPGERGALSAAEFSARARSGRPTRRADLRALAEVARAPVSSIEGAPRGLIGSFSLAARDLEAVITRNVAGGPRVHFASAPPLRSVALLANAADTTEAAEREGRHYLRTLLHMERLASLGRAA